MHALKGTKRVVVSTITVGSECRAALLEERISVQVEAKVRGADKSYSWLAKMLRADSDEANRARFQGTLETEVSFYQRLVPELNSLGCPLPKMYPMIWADYKSLNREVLIVEDMARREGYAATRAKKEGKAILNYLCKQFAFVRF